MADRELRNAGEAARAGEDALRSYRDQAARLRKEDGEVRGSIRPVARQFDGMIEGVVAAVLPDASEATVAVAGQMFGAVRLTRGHAEAFQEIARWQTRRDMIAADPRFAGADAEIAASIRRDDAITQELVRLRREQSAFERDEDFLALYAANAAPIVPRNPAWIVFRNVFLLGFLWVPIVAWRQERAWKQRVERVCDTYVNAAILDLFERYEALPHEIRAAEQRERDEVHLQRALRTLKKEHADAGSELLRLESSLPSRLRAQLADHLRSLAPAAWIEIRANVPEALRLAVTTIMALKEKTLRLEQMSEYLRKEARDRDARIGELQKAVAAWRRRPSRVLSSDITAALVTQPAQLARATAARATGVRAMSQTVCGYGDYLLYDALLLQHGHLLFWDLAACNGHGAFPSAAFQHLVLPDVGAHNVEHPDVGATLAEQFPEATEGDAMGAALDAFDAPTEEFGECRTDAMDVAAAFEDPMSFEGAGSRFPDTTYDAPDDTWSRGNGGGYGSFDASPEPSHGGSSFSSGCSDPSPSCSDPSPSTDSGGSFSTD